MSFLDNLLHSSQLPVEGGINFRDQGGLPTTDGRKVKKGLLFRSGALDRLTETDCHYLKSIPLVHILDYRDPAEIAAHRDVIWSGANYENIPANPSDEKLSASLNDVIKKENSSTCYMTDLYRELPFKNPAYYRLIELLKQPDNYALVQHCAIGKDRTGVGSAITLFILGADYQTVMEDYLLTEITLEPFRKELLSKFAQQHDDKAMEVFRHMFAAKPEFLDSAIDAINERYGSIDKWLALEYGLNNEIKQQIRDKYLEG